MHFEHGLNLIDGLEPIERLVKSHKPINRGQKLLQIQTFSSALNQAQSYSEPSEASVDNSIQVEISDENSSNQRDI